MSAATPEATANLARRNVERGRSKAAYRILGRTGLTVSALGFGAYRVDAGTPEHGMALQEALEGGCNLIDTSTNYTDGESEERIGDTLQAMCRGERISREATVVVSKIGYVQGRNLDLARRKEASGDPFPEMVKISGGCWHCIHPEFLADQLTRSLQRLKLERLDVCLLHNPEYFLEQAHDPAKREEARHEFYRRIRAAFAHLEKEVQAGRIAWYGVSSNSFGAEPGSPDATSLGRMLEAARKAAKARSGDEKEHRFAVAQLPMNLFEHDPLTVRKEGPSGEFSTLTFAADQQVGILVNRPLNAFHRGELVRLADFRLDAPPISLDSALAAVARLENELERSLGPEVKAGTGRSAVEWFSWGEQLQGTADRIGGYEHWQAIEDQQISPRLFHSVRTVRSSMAAGPAEQFEAWLETYLSALGDLLAVLRSQSAARSQERSDRIASALREDLPTALRDESLSRKALHAVASVPGVTCVLNGMRRPAYVADSMEILKWEPIPGAEKLFGRF
ncbi:MAG TPA: aldo/keto reductase [Candidatus Polarisedimenticolia bacterium]|nr:aldo/keto reductase [Candidatus Polarisedimenticolia bacterium]